MAKKSTKKIVVLSSKPSKKNIADLENFIEFVPVKRLNKNLRKIFLLYLSYEKDGLPSEFEEFIIDLYFLFEFWMRWRKQQGAWRNN